MDATIQVLKHLLYTLLLLLGLATLITTFGCGRHERDPHVTPKQEECNVVKAENQTTITCPDGSTAIVNDGIAGDRGDQGPAGVQGSTGPQGIDGNQGVPGSSVVPILPCPSLTSPYPEELFCIDRTLYAVYDANSAQVHLAAIPAGNYVTTDGRACHFTVIAGCEIQ